MKLKTVIKRKSIFVCISHNTKRMKKRQNRYIWHNAIDIIRHNTKRNDENKAAAFSCVSPSILRARAFTRAHTHTRARFFYTRAYTRIHTHTRGFLYFPRTYVRVRAYTHAHIYAYASARTRNCQVKILDEQVFDMSRSVGCQVKILYTFKTRFKTP